jgi:hypothetical protein
VPETYFKVREPQAMSLQQSYAVGNGEDLEFEKEET